MKPKSARRAGDSFIDASTSNLFLDREGDENEYEPKYLRKIADYYKNMGMISEASLPMPREVYGGIEDAIAAANLAEADNEYADFRGGFEKTDLAIVLERAINGFFRRIKLPVRAKAISIDSLAFKDKEPRLQNNENPNRLVVAAQADMDKRGNGLIYLMVVTAEDDFDNSRMNIDSIARETANVIRHELMHDRQYSSLARDLGITREEAKEKFIGWGLVPGEDAPREDYLKSHIEIDAFGHEFAERLAQKFGLKKAEQMVSNVKVTDLQNLADQMDAEMGENFAEYFRDNPNEKFTNKLQKKIRKFLRAFREQGLYEPEKSKAMELTTEQLRRIIRASLLSEELNKSDKTEIEKIARKTAKKEISKVVGTSLEKTIQKEVEKTLKTRATKEELSKITKAVMKKLYKDLAISYPTFIDRIKV